MPASATRMMSSTVDPCSGKRGHAEAAGDVALVEHGIGGDPEPQAFGKNLRLLDAGFRHQDHELVATVAGYDVRLAALLFQQAADARQHQVAFQVTLVSFTSLNLSRSTITTENGRPEREARCHSACTLSGRSGVS